MTERSRTATVLFPDNGALVRACREGDSVAWAEIVDRYERLVYAVPLREGLSFDQAADVAQETFATLMTSLHSIRQPDRLASWLMTVARRLSWRERGRAGTLVIDLTDVDVEDEHDPEAEWETVEWVYEAVAALGEPCRTLVLSMFFDPSEPSYAEIALRLGRPVGSVGPLRGRCLDRLRDLLEGSS